MADISARSGDGARAPDPIGSPVRGQASSGSAWIPAVDIYAQGDDLVIRCELAGVAREDMELALCRGQLWISGERAGAPEGADLTDYVRERRYGPFRRTINLPPRVERNQLRATLELGLLEVVVKGGASPAQDERIEIEAADRDEVSIDVGPTPQYDLRSSRRTGGRR
jgi:HSP20 family protein